MTCCLITTQIVQKIRVGQYPQKKRGWDLWLKIRAFRETFRLVTKNVSDWFLNPQFASRNVPTGVRQYVGLHDCHDNMRSKRFL